MTSSVPASSMRTPAPPSRATRRRVIAACFLGNFVEWFDYAMYGYLAVVISQVFFPAEDATASLLATFAVFATSFAVRPVGGIVWGYIGDRWGRKTALSWSILIMSGSTFLIACLPSYQAIGLAAPLLMLLLRIVQGFSAAGEYAGAAAFLAEYAPDRNRGLQTSVVPASTATGLLVGSLVAALLTAVFDEEAMASFGWRIPFLMALPLGLIGWYIRVKLEDTPAFRELDAGESKHSAPVKETLVRNRKAIGLAFGVTLLNAVGFYMLLSYMPTYLSQELGLGQTQAFVATSVSLSVYVGFIFGAGTLSDRFGRKRMLMTAAASFVVLAVPIFFLMPGATYLGVVLLIVLLSAMLSMNDGTLACYLVEAFPTKVRYTGFAFSFNTANAIFGGSAPFVATLLIQTTGSALAPAWYLAGAAAITLVAMLYSAETSGRPLR